MLAYDKLEAGVLFVTPSLEDCFTQLTSSSVRFSFTSEFPSPRWTPFTTAEKLHLPHFKRCVLRESKASQFKHPGISLTLVLRNYL